jgi:HEAT repeat protein
LILKPIYSASAEFYCLACEFTRKQIGRVYYNGEGMSEELKPYQVIQTMANERRNLPDEEILTELANLDVLPDEDDLVWDEDEIWDKIAYKYIALADVAAERRLRPALPLLLEKACYGDPGEIMRGLRNKLEAIVNPEWSYLTDVCIKAAQSNNKGSRLWAIDELRVLQDKRAFQTLVDALHDSASWVRQFACSALVTLSQTNEECRIPAIEALEKLIEEQNEDSDQYEGNEAIRRIKDIIKQEESS